MSSDKNDVLIGTPANRQGGDIREGIWPQSYIIGKIGQGFGSGASMTRQTKEGLPEPSL
jgi:hypothetical protein